MPRSGRPLNGSMRTRAAEARACPMACAIPAPRQPSNSASSERPDAFVRAQATEATNSGVTATPSLRLQDRQTGRAILLQGPIEGDALLSAMDMLAAEDTASDSAITPVTPTSEMPADVVGDMPR